MATKKGKDIDSSVQKKGARKLVDEAVTIRLPSRKYHLEQKKLSNNIEELRNEIEMIKQVLAMNTNKNKRVDFTRFLYFLKKDKTDIPIKKIEETSPDVWEKRKSESEQSHQRIHAEKMASLDANRLIEKRNVELKKLDDAISSKNEELEQLYELVFDISSGLTNDKKTCRYFPVSIYYSGDAVENESYISKLLKTVDNLLEEYGFKRVISLPPLYASFYDKFIYKLKKNISDEDKEKLLNELKERLSIEVIGKPQSEIDALSASSVAKILDAAGENELCLVLNSVYILRVKNNDGKFVVISNKLSTEQLKTIRDNPKLQCNPQLFLEAICKKPESPAYKPNIPICEKDNKNRVSFSTSKNIKRFPSPKSKKSSPPPKLKDTKP